MARKMNTIERQIAQTYRAWLRQNEDAPRRVKIVAFNRIADGYQQQTEKQETAA